MLSSVSILGVLQVLAFVPLATALPQPGFPQYSDHKSPPKHYEPPQYNPHRPIHYGPSDLCKVEVKILAAITAEPYHSDALAYCSSILNLPVVTYSATSTIDITSTSTTIETSTSTISTETTTTVLETITTTTPLATTTIAPAPIVFVRGQQKKCPLPKPMSAWKDALITSACSCIASQIVLSTTTTVPLVTSTSIPLFTSTEVPLETTTSVTVTTTDLTATADTSTVTIQATPTCSASPIVNGGFDTGDFTGWTFSIQGSGSMTTKYGYGWNSPYSANPKCTGPSTTSTVSKVVLTQTLNTCIGVTYDVGFFYNNEQSATNNFLVVKADGVELQNINGNNPDNRGVPKYSWSQTAATFPIVATSEQTVLEIDFVCGYKRQLGEWLFDTVTVVARQDGSGGITN